MCEGEPCARGAEWDLTLPDSNSAANIGFFCTEHVIEAVAGLLREGQGVCVERHEP